MRILFACSGAVVSGAEITALQLMLGLRDRGHSVHCLASAWNNGEFVARLAEHGISHTVARLGFFYLSRPDWTFEMIRNYPKLLIDVSRLLRQFDPDIVYHIGYRSALMLKPVLRGRRSVIHFPEVTAGRRIRRAIAFTAASAHGFVAVSEFVQSWVHDLGISPARIHVAYPIAGEGPAAAPSKARARVRRIGIVGRIDLSKGHLDLIDALARLVGRGVSFECSIFGAGDVAAIEAVKRRVAGRDLERFVRWEGYQRDPAKIYEHLDIVAVPSRIEEAFGRAALEPALWSIPVVASRRGGLPEVVVDGVTGLLFEPENVTDLADKLACLLNDPEKAEKLGAQARARANEMFDKATILAGLERYLSGLLTAQELEPRRS
jgi:glycosyltransferase involved in cell wall biosynthesis